MRYERVEEVTKNGRKKEIQYGLKDNLTGDIVARFADPARIDDIIRKYNAAQLAAENGKK